MTPTTKVWILSDSRIFRDAISSRLVTEDGVELLGAAATVRDLLQSGLAERADVVLVHAADDSTNGDPTDTAEITWRIKRLLPSARVVVVGQRPNEPNAVRTIEAGASAWLGDGTSYEELVEAIRAAATGCATIGLEMLGEISRRICSLKETLEAPTTQLRQELSNRETDVARLMALGLVNKQIAKRLGIRLSTAKNHVHNVLKKLRIERRQDLVGVAWMQ